MPEAPVPPSPSQGGVIMASREQRESSIREDAPRAERRFRRHKGGGTNDQFAIDPATIPPGTSYEWKRQTVMGQPDVSYSVMMREQGFTEVPSSRHPELVTEDHKGPITRGGLVLMERPEYLTKEAQAEDSQNARDLVRTKEAQLSGAPEGTLERVKPTLSRTYDAGLGEGMEIPS